MAVDRRQSRGEDRRSSMRDRARKRAEEREGQGGGGSKYTLPEGVQFFSPKKHANLDIIPYVVSVDGHPENIPKGELWYQRTIFVHYGVGAEDKSYLCLKTVKKKCPICEHRTQLMKDQSADEETVKQLRSKERELFNVYDRDDPDKGVQLWEISNYNFGAKLEEELREGKSEWAGFAEPVDGFTLKVRFTEEQIGKNKFMQASRIDFEERKSIDKKILGQALDLDKILKIFPYDQLEKIFLGVDGGDGGGLQQEQQEQQEVDGNQLGSRGARQPEQRRESASTVAEPPLRGRSEPNPQSRREARLAEKKSEQLVCPVDGGVFGKDCDGLDACKDCEIWEKCIEEQERLNAGNGKQQR